MRLLSSLSHRVVASAVLLAAPAALLLQAAPAHAGVFISVNIAPPMLPVYTQPICPGDGYIWTPGYWAWSDDGYYWVPGVWVQPPSVGLLWTPAYWGWGGGGYMFYPGYWGPHVGFYGGINYGFGYGGAGYEGGYWNHGVFAYNRAVNNINVTNVHNVYNKTVIVNNNYNRVAFNGGNGGVQARPTQQEQMAQREQHLPPTINQQTHIQNAAADRNQFAKVNGGRPQTLAQPRIGERGGNQQAGIGQAARQGNAGAYNPQQRQNGASQMANGRPAYQQGAQNQQPRQQTYQQNQQNQQQNRQPQYQQQNRQTYQQQNQQTYQQQNRQPQYQQQNQQPYQQQNRQPQYQQQNRQPQYQQQERPAPRESAPPPRGGENHDNPHR